MPFLFLFVPFSMNQESPSYNYTFGSFRVVLFTPSVKPSVEKNLVALSIQRMGTISSLLTKKLNKPFSVGSSVHIILLTFVSRCSVNGKRQPWSAAGDLPIPDGLITIVWSRGGSKGWQGGLRHGQIFEIVIYYSLNWSIRTEVIIILCINVPNIINLNKYILPVHHYVLLFFQQNRKI